jgi:hypothetical protein
MIRWSICQLPRTFQREARFAAAAGTRQCDQPKPVERVLEFDEFACASDEEVV